MVDFDNKDEAVGLLAKLVLALASRSVYISTGEHSLYVDIVELERVADVDLVVEVAGGTVRLRGLPRDSALARFVGGGA